MIPENLARIIPVADSRKRNMKTQINSNSASVKPKVEFDFKSMKELRSMPIESTEYCVEGLLPCSGLSVLAGKPKTGKSTCSRQLAAAVAEGKPFLGRATVKGKVLYIAIEEKPSEVRNHFEALGLSGDENILTHFGSTPDTAIMDLLGLLKNDLDIRLVIIDPIFKFTRVKDTNDYASVYAAMENLLDLARKFRVHILTVHHNKKKFGDDWADSVLGSTAITASVDTILGLFMDEDVRVLVSRQRYGKELPKTQIVFDETKGEMSLGKTVDEAKKQKANETHERIEEDIINYLNAHPDSTQDAIFTSIKGKTLTIKRVFRNMIDMGLIKEVGTGIKGQPFQYRVFEIQDEAIDEKAIANVAI